MIDGRHVAADEVTQLRVGAHVGPGRELGLADLAHRLGVRDLPDQVDAPDQRVDVGPVGQVAGVDQRPVPRVVAAQRNPAPAVHVHERDQDGHAAIGRVGQAAVAERHRQHVPLEVRSGQAGLAADEAAGLGDVGRHRAGMGELPAEQVLRPRQLGQALHAGRGPQGGDDRMVGQVGTDTRAVHHHPDVVLAQVVGRADAGQHQQLRAVDRAAAQDDLGIRPGHVLGAALACSAPRPRARPR